MNKLNYNSDILNQIKILIDDESDPGTNYGMSKILEYVDETGNKQIILFLLDKYLEELFENLGYDQFASIIFRYFIPIEIIDIVTFIYHRDYDIYEEFLSQISYQLMYQHNNKHKWKTFIKLYKKRISSTEKIYFLIMSLLFREYKKMDRIMEEIKSCKTDFLPQDPNFEFGNSYYCSLLEMGMNKSRMIKLINEFRDFYNSDDWDCNNIIYCKCSLDSKDILTLLNNVYLISKYKIKNRYVLLKKMMAKCTNKIYNNFMKHIKIHILTKNDNVNLELFYHQHRRDKLDLNRILMLPARLLYKAITIILSAFISKNLTRLSGYYV